MNGSLSEKIGTFILSPTGILLLTLLALIYWLFKKYQTPIKLLVRKLFSRKLSIFTIVLILLLLWSFYRIYDLEYKNKYLDTLSSVCMDSLTNTRNEMYQTNGELSSLKASLILNKNPSCYDPNLPVCNKQAYALGMAQCTH